MRHTALLTLLLISTSFTFTKKQATIPSDSNPSFGTLSQTHCKSAFGGNVKTYTLKDGRSKIGHAIWISRKSQKVKAKYFAHKQYGQTVYQRFNTWKGDKSLVLMSSGAYSERWDVDSPPTGLTVDNGEIVNRNYRSDMDGLVIVYATGGIVVSNIEDGDLYLGALRKKVDITNYRDRAEFLQWAKKERATVFQTHLLAYKNELKTGHNGSSSTSRRKVLALARKRGGELFHIIFYMKDRNYSIHNAADAVLSFLKRQRMDVVAIVNLDTGSYDIIDTNRTVKDCHGDRIRGTRNSSKRKLTNMLAYEYLN